MEALGDVARSLSGAIHEGTHMESGGVHGGGDHKGGEHAAGGHEGGGHGHHESALASRILVSITLCLLAG